MGRAAWRFKLPLASKAPRAGDRAPDGRCLCLPLLEETTLFQLFQTPVAHLLLFAGPDQSKATHTNLSRIARTAEQLLGAEVDAYLVVSDTRAMAPRWGGSLLYDINYSLHTHYGIRASSLAFIRPDGYIGFLSQMADAHDPIQELVITARRNQILDAATQVFAQKGFHRATIKDIARVAGIADGTLYTYFQSKTAVLLGILKRLNESTEHEQHFLPQNEQDMRSFFTSYLRQRMSLLWPNAEVFQAVLPEMLVNAELRELYYQQVLVPTFNIAERYFEAQSQQEQPRPIDVPLTVHAIAGMLFGLLTLQLLGDEEIAARWQELPEVLATLLFDGLQRSLKPPTNR